MDTTAETGQCNEWQYTYKCLTKAQETGQQTTCTDGLFDNGGFPTPPPGKGTFTNGAVGLEILGEAARYRDSQNGIFWGVPESCRKGYGGVQNCCKSMPGAQTNSQVLTTVVGAGASVAKYAGEKLVDMASPYVFDAMYSNGIFSEALASNFSLADGSLGTALSAGGLSVGAYGFTVGTGTMSAGLLGGNMQLASFGSNGYLAFNPYVFAIMVAMQVYQALSKCSEAEQMLAMHRGANLSVFIKESCSKKAFGSCVQYVDEFCSFNSILAKIVNIQGKTQLGLPLEGCAGLTVDQISAIDFTKVDFSEFTDEMTQQAISHVPTNIGGNYQPIQQNAHSGSAQSGTNAVLPSY
jgi:conjugal transfer mating pair stabilization protein TraN